MPAGLGVILGAAAALRALPLAARYLGPELQEGYPRNAVIALVRDDWQPFALVHGAVLLDVLRAVYTVWYGVGRLLGVYHDRIDVLAAFVRDPVVFVVMGRLVVLSAALVAIWLAYRVAARLAGARAGLAAAMSLAVCSIHVRESLHVWPDAVAATAAMAAVALAVAMLDRGTLPRALSLGVLTGAAVASKHSVFALVLPVAAAVWWGTPGRAADRVRRLACVGAVAAATYAMLAPYTFWRWADALLQVRIQSAGAFGGPGTRDALGFPRLLVTTLGTGPLALALCGVVASARRELRPTLVAAGFPLVYLAMLGAATTVFARYVVVAAPFVAVFAGVGAAVLAGRIAPRRPGVALVALLAAACAGQARESWEHVRLLTRTDTRVLAGEWLSAHVPPGTVIALPNLAPYANPVAPIDRLRLGIEYREWASALAARGIGDAATTYRVRYQGFLDRHDESWRPTEAVIVTAAHPLAARVLETPAANDDLLRAAGYHVVARFDAIDEPPAADVVFDPLDADYVPLAGAASVARPGPNLRIWRAP